MAIIQPVDQFLSEVNREECRKPVLYKIMGKAMKSVSKAAFWVNFMYGDLSVENAMRVGYACPHVHPEMENDPEKLPLIIRDQVFDAIDRSPSGNVIAGAQGTIEGQLKDHVTYPDKKVHLYDETVDRFIGNITPEKEAECIALTEEYPYLISAGAHSEEGVNTIMRNPDSYVYRQPYIFNINPEDAKEMNLAEGQWVKVTTKAGTIKIPVHYNYRAARGFGNINHHFGLYDEEGKAYGEAVNILTSSEDADEVRIFTVMYHAEWKLLRRENTMDSGIIKMKSILEAALDQQKEKGWVSEKDIKLIASIKGIPEAKVYETLSFYSMILLEKPASVRIEVCRGTSCYIADGVNLVEEIQNMTGCTVGGRSEDGRYQIEYCECLGHCETAPNIIVNGRLYTSVTRDSLNILK